jgi:hypothetical protein
MRTMPIELVRHPASPPLAVTVEGRCVAAADGGLDVHFALRGALDSIVVPLAALPERLDGLWRHTCCELFLGHAGGADYLEYNLSPSGAWAAYAFSAYRVPAAPPDVAAPAIRSIEVHDALTIDAHVDREALALLGDPPVLEVGLTVVIECAAGEVRHYALHHPRPRADFHDARGFVLRVPMRAPA